MDTKENIEERPCGKVFYFGSKAIDVPLEEIIGTALKCNSHKVFTFKADKDNNAIYAVVGAQDKEDALDIYLKGRGDEDDEKWFMKNLVRWSEIYKNPPYLKYEPDDSGVDEDDDEWTKIDI